MKRNKRLLGIALIGIMLMTGCGKSKINDLPKNAVPITMDTFVNNKDSDDTYGAIKYNGREYIGYGVQGKAIEEHMISECFGYGAEDSNERYYSLVDTDDYIANYYINGEMMQFNFYRATDTIVKEIYTPDYITSLEYDIWE